MKGISVRYEGPLNSELDDLITKILEEAGFEWWASGMDVDYGGREPGPLMRDLAFDLPRKTNE